MLSSYWYREIRKQWRSKQSSRVGVKVNIATILNMHVSLLVACLSSLLSYLNKTNLIHNQDPLPRMNVWNNQKMWSVILILYMYICYFNFGWHMQAQIIVMWAMLGHCAPPSLLLNIPLCLAHCTGRKWRCTTIRYAIAMLRTFVWFCCIFMAGGWNQQIIKSLCVNFSSSCLILFFDSFYPQEWTHCLSWDINCWRWRCVWWGDKW